MNTLERANKIGLWLGMDQEIKTYAKICPVCQLQKTTRIKNQAESILPDRPINPNDKISMDIFGPLPQTERGNKYILSIQDRLTRYTFTKRDDKFYNRSLNRALYLCIRSTQNKSNRPRSKFLCQTYDTI